MSAVDNGGAAFPGFKLGSSAQSGQPVALPVSGMSLRDYFAAKAMQGILAGNHPITHELDCLNITAITAYKMADAMLEARKS